MELLDQLKAYVQELLTVSLLPSLPPKRASATHKRPAKQAINTAASSATQPSSKPSLAPPTQTAASPVKSPASDATELDNASNDASSGGGAKTKKKGKKKRSVLANNSNPHHVKNCESQHLCLADLQMYRRALPRPLCLSIPR